MRAVARAAILAGLAVSLGACGGSQLVWYGHTPARTERLEVRQEHGAQRLVVGQWSSRAYAYVAASDIAFAPDGRSFAFAAEVSDKPERWRVVSGFVEGPTWNGVAGLRYSPTGRLVYAALDGKRWRVVVDGAPQRPFDEVDVDSIALSPDGRRVGYVASEGDCTYAVIDGAAGGCVARVVGLALGESAEHDVVVTAGAPDGSEAHVLVAGRRVLDLPRARTLVVDPTVRHWAVVALSPEGWRVVADGSPGDAFDEIDHVTWAPDGRTVAYDARRDRAWYVVANDARSDPHAEVEAPVFAAATSRFGYLARDANGSTVVLDDRVVWRGPPAASALAVSDDGRHAGWFYRDDAGAWIVVDSARYRFDVAVERTLRFSHDGRHWAALAGSLAEKRLFIVVDGVAQVPFDAEELFGSPAGDPSSRLAAWVSAELELRLRSQGS